MLISSTGDEEAGGEGTRGESRQLPRGGDSDQSDIDYEYSEGPLLNIKCFLV